MLACLFLIALELCDAWGLNGVHDDASKLTSILLRFLSKHPLPQQPQQILPIAILGQRPCQLLQSAAVNPALVEGNFFRAGHFEALAPMI